MAWMNNDYMIRGKLTEEKWFLSISGWLSQSRFSIGRRLTESHRQRRLARSITAASSHSRPDGSNPQLTS